MPIGQVLRFLAVAGAALAAAIPAVRAQDIVTTGNCSPVITNISGAVNVNVTCIDADSNKPKFRVTYYRVGGLALSFLLDGLLTPEWAERLGGQQAIVRNAVSEEARTFLDQFATPIEGSSLFGDIGLKDGEYYGSLADYAKSVDPTVKFRDGNEGQFPDLDPKRWRAYYGGGRVDQIFVPDIEAARILFETPGWPENYGMLYGGTDGEYPPTVEDGKMMPAPLLWRWLTQADLDGFEDGYERYVRAVLEKIVPTAGGTPIDVGGNETVDEILASRMSGDLYDGIDSIRYLAREGLPDNFMLVRGWIGQHYGWAFTSTPRDFQLLIAVFENVSDGPIELGDFTLRQIDAMTLRQNAETDAELATSLPERKRVYPPGVLKPKEKVVVPVRIELPQAEVYNDPARDLRGSARAGRRVLSQIRLAGDAPISIRDYNEVELFRKVASGFPNQSSPNIVERFEYGPAWRIENVEVDGASYSFRQHDPNNFVLLAGVEVGSCPHVFVYRNDGGIWQSEGHILYGAISPSRAREDEKPLPDFEGRVKIAEIEHEVSVIDRVRLKLEAPDGSVTWHAARNLALKASDGHELVLAHGDELEIDFGLVPDDWKGRKASLVADGYYVPFTTPRLFASDAPQ